MVQRRRESLLLRLSTILCNGNPWIRSDGALTNTELRMTNQRLRGLIWWRKWTRREWTIAAVGFTILILVFSLLSNSRTKNLSATDSDWVPLTLLRNAKNRGAFCLDGSIPGYHFQKGFGSGSVNWVLHIEGGGWCNTIESCSVRKNTALGSSKYMDHQVQFNGILGHDPSQNPDFFNWNKVKIRYCDGASFAGHPESESKHGKELFFRGQLIWEALLDELLSIGLSNARQALLSGCSAGGLATLIHCDNFREILPKAANVKCLSDAGFFLNQIDIAGNHTIESFYHDVVHLQGVAKGLDKDCMARTEPFKCFFPQEFINNIKTPLFLVNPAYDFWQIQHILVPDASDLHHSWFKCRLNIRDCNPSQIEVLQGFRNSLLDALKEFQRNKEGGMFINSCFIHCQTWTAETWHSPISPRINNKTIAESVGDWYFDREVVKQIDCAYPCNPTCYNMEFTQS
ncbi:pectin acetylesterase 5-like [Cornus florida]|uniref:pectin acetylesterase 5-like n=1 Tax=Cornus florida TaxID=4283 RepID=UPI0028A21C19|nr:pectin acetylesterase 5-like [Cornus florida]